MARVALTPDGTRTDAAGMSTNIRAAVNAGNPDVKIAFGPPPKPADCQARLKNGQKCQAKSWQDGLCKRHWKMHHDSE